MARDKGTSYGELVTTLTRAKVFLRPPLCRHSSPPPVLDTLPLVNSYLPFSAEIPFVNSSIITIMYTKWRVSYCKDAFRPLYLRGNRRCFVTLKATPVNTNNLIHYSYGQKTLLVFGCCIVLNVGSKCGGSDGLCWSWVYFLQLGNGQWFGGSHRVVRRK